jgi:hypothetical protein
MGEVEVLASVVWRAATTIDGLRLFALVLCCGCCCCCCGGGNGGGGSGGTTSSSSSRFLLRWIIFLNLEDFWSSFRTQSGFIPAAMHKSHLHRWHFLLVFTVTSQPPPFLQSKEGVRVFWMARLKKALQLKHVLAP